MAIGFYFFLALEKKGKEKSALPGKSLLLLRLCYYHLQKIRAIVAQEKEQTRWSTKTSC